MSTFVDTSALLAVLDASDESHDVADRVWRRLIEADEHLIATSYVVVETFAFVQARLGLPALRALADDVLPLLHVEWLDGADHSAAVKRLFSANRRKLSLVDCASFECMRRFRLRRAFVFDAHFTREGFESST